MSLIFRAFFHRTALVMSGGSPDRTSVRTASGSESVVLRLGRGATGAGSNRRIFRSFSSGYDGQTRSCLRVKTTSQLSHLRMEKRLSQWTMRQVRAKVKEERVRGLGLPPVGLGVRAFGRIEVTDERAGLLEKRPSLAKGAMRHETYLSFGSLYPYLPVPREVASVQLLDGSVGIFRQ